MNGATNMNVNNGGRAAVPENSTVGPSEFSLNHNFTLSSKWNRDEQSVVDELLARHASETRQFQFAKIGQVLGVKSIRDVAFWCKSMNKEVGKKRKHDNGYQRNKRAKKEKIVEQQVKPSSHATNHANDVISYEAFDCALGQLLEQNAQTLDQISANISDLKIHENINLFVQTRNNILKILNNLNDMPGVMKQLPPLPVKLNDELANSILP